MSYDDPWGGPAFASNDPITSYGTAVPASLSGSGGGLAALFNGVGPLSTLFGTGLNAYGKISGGNALGDAYRAEADNLAVQVTANTNQALAEQHVRDQKLKATISAQTAIQASRNVVDDSGSA